MHVPDHYHFMQFHQCMVFHDKYVFVICYKTEYLDLIAVTTFPMAEITNLYMPYTMP